MSLQVDVSKQAYHQAEAMDDEDDGEEEDEEEEEAANPRDVGHNIYILAHQVGFDTTICSLSVTKKVGLGKSSIIITNNKGGNSAFYVRKQVYSINDGYWKGQVFSLVHIFTKQLTITQDAYSIVYSL